MSIPIFVIVIEKTESGYTAYTPNISGVSVTAESREEVERLIIEQMSSYLEDLEAQHSDSQRRLKITTAPLAEKVSCRYTWGGNRHGEIPVVLGPRMKDYAASIGDFYMAMRSNRGNTSKNVNYVARKII